MRPNKFTKLLEGIGQKASEYSPQILMGIGIAGSITATVLAVKATPKALQLIEAKKEEEGVEKLTVVDTVKSTWKCYIPTAVTMTASTACLISSCSVSTRRMAALATAYKVSETALIEYKEALREYRDSVIETVGEESEKKIKENFVNKQSESDQVTNKTVIVSNADSYKCLEVQTGREFVTTYLELKTAEVNLKERILNDGYASLNEMYDELDIERTDTGYDVGWNRYGTGFPRLSIDADVNPRTGELRYILEYTRPIREYAD